MTLYILFLLFGRISRFYVYAVKSIAKFTVKVFTFFLNSHLILCHQNILSDIFIKHHWTCECSFESLRIHLHELFAAFTSKPYLSNTCAISNEAPEKVYLLRLNKFSTIFALKLPRYCMISFRANFSEAFRATHVCYLFKPRQKLVWLR